MKSINLRKIFKSAKNKIITSVVSVVFMVQMGGMAFANDAQDAISKVTNGEGGLGLFDDVKGTVASIGSDAYSLIQVCAVVGAIICFAIAAIVTMFKKKSQDRAESKSWMVTILIFFGAIFVIGWIVTTIMKIASGIK